MLKKLLYGLLIIGGLSLVLFYTTSLGRPKVSKEEKEYPASIIALRDCKLEGKLGKMLSACLFAKKEEAMGKKNKPKPKE